MPKQHLPKQFYSDIKLLPKEKNFKSSNNSQQKLDFYQALSSDRIQIKSVDGKIKKEIKQLQNIQQNSDKKTLQLERNKQSKEQKFNSISYKKLNAFAKNKLDFLLQQAQDNNFQEIDRQIKLQKDQQYSQQQQKQKFTQKNDNFKDQKKMLKLNLEQLKIDSQDNKDKNYQFQKLFPQTDRIVQYQKDKSHYFLQKQQNLFNTNRILNGEQSKKQKQNENCNTNFYRINNDNKNNQKRNHSDLTKVNLKQMKLNDQVVDLYQFINNNNKDGNLKNSQKNLNNHFLKMNSKQFSKNDIQQNSQKMKSTEYYFPSKQQLIQNQNKSEKIINDQDKLEKKSQNIQDAPINNLSRQNSDRFSAISPYSNNNKTYYNFIKNFQSIEKNKNLVQNKTEKSSKQFDQFQKNNLHQNQISQLKQNKNNEQYLNSEKQKLQESFDQNSQFLKSLVKFQQIKPNKQTHYVDKKIMQGQNQLNKEQNLIKQKFAENLQQINKKLNTLSVNEVNNQEKNDMNYEDKVYVEKKDYENENLNNSKNSQKNEQTPRVQEKVFLRNLEVAKNGYQYGKFIEITHGKF
ncbi:hypothetical protein PPERSA_09582 [Pseudocohnilembus persalinus]|uniref:Uncharacterized protein n=1 Tax=Pseudocohnilembus persalinus TaxID=266149 RepID=A0A0V0QFT4_PSEPJ|nr:hypothetical protein PPERSA_09582 [Pseudocohnilembus persalinus]|eukprot:KRX00976.1 hypothetical protein PPERSA_09582 [Pseudocohnilembus persalinus]